MTAARVRPTRPAGGVPRCRDAPGMSDMSRAEAAVAATYSTQPASISTPAHPGGGLGAGVEGAFHRRQRGDPGAGTHELRSPTNPRRFTRLRCSSARVLSRSGVGPPGLHVRLQGVEWLPEGNERRPRSVPRGLSGPLLRPAARQALTSLMSAMRFASGSRKNAIHNSWSGNVAMRWGSASKTTPRADRFANASSRSETL
jgi:hypothetical protein